jgi:protein kinase-like protein
MRGAACSIAVIGTDTEVADGIAEPWAAAGGFPAGFRIAGYRLTEQIGRGGMAIVYRAQDERLNREVALKVLAPSQAADGAFRQRFIQESYAAAAVDDPNIIPVFEAGEAAGVLFIAMRLVRGGDVRSLVRRDGPLPVHRAARLTAAAASALDTAHAAGLVHRDVKPANMLLDVRPGRPDHVYVSDFGLSKSSLGAGGLTGSDQFLGTVDYAAPEQLAGKHVDGRADQYALGCTAFELLSGQPPYRRDQGLAVIYAHMTAPPPQLTRMRPDLPAETDDIFRRVLAKDPAARYGSCQEFADALRQALGLGFHADETGSAMLAAVTGAARPGGAQAPAAGGHRRPGSGRGVPRDQRPGHGRPGRARHGRRNRPGRPAGAGRGGAGGIVPDRAGLGSPGIHRPRPRPQGARQIPADGPDRGPAHAGRRGRDRPDPGRPMVGQPQPRGGADPECERVAERAREPALAADQAGSHPAGPRADICRAADRPARRRVCGPGGHSEQSPLVNERRRRGRGQPGRCGDRAVCGGGPDQRTGWRGPRRRARDRRPAHAARLRTPHPGAAAAAPPVAPGDQPQP